MPNQPRSALADYLAGPRIPGSRRWDLDEIAELDPRKNPLSLTHMLPSTEAFAEACGACDGPSHLSESHDPRFSSARSESK